MAQSVFCVYTFFCFERTLLWNVVFSPQKVPAAGGVAGDLFGKISKNYL